MSVVELQNTGYKTSVELIDMPSAEDYDIFQKEYDDFLKTVANLPSSVTRDELATKQTNALEEDIYKATAQNLINGMDLDIAYDAVNAGIYRAEQERMERKKIALEEAAAENIVEEKLAEDVQYNVTTANAEDTTDPTASMSRFFIQKYVIDKAVKDHPMTLLDLAGRVVGPVATDIVFSKTKVGGGFLGAGVPAAFDTAILGDTIYNTQKYYAKKWYEILENPYISNVEVRRQLDALVKEIEENIPRMYQAEVFTGIQQGPDPFADGGDVLSWASMILPFKGLSQATRNLVRWGGRHGVPVQADPKNVEKFEEILSNKPNKNTKKAEQIAEENTKVKREEKKQLELDLGDRQQGELFNNLPEYETRKEIVKDIEARKTETAPQEQFSFMFDERTTPEQLEFIFEDSNKVGDIPTKAKTNDSLYTGFSYSVKETDNGLVYGTSSSGPVNVSYGYGNTYVQASPLGGTIPTVDTLKGAKEAFRNYDRNGGVVPFTTVYDKDYPGMVKHDTDFGRVVYFDKDNAGSYSRALKQARVYENDLLPKDHALFVTNTKDGIVSYAWGKNTPELLKASLDLKATELLDGYDEKALKKINLYSKRAAIYDKEAYPTLKEIKKLLKAANTNISGNGYSDTTMLINNQIRKVREELKGYGISATTLTDMPIETRRAIVALKVYSDYLGDLKEALKNVSVSEYHKSVPSPEVFTDKYIMLGEDLTNHPNPKVREFKGDVNNLTEADAKELGIYGVARRDGYIKMLDKSKISNPTKIITHTSDTIEQNLIDKQAGVVYNTTDGQWYPIISMSVDASNTSLVVPYRKKNVKTTLQEVNDGLKINRK